MESRAWVWWLGVAALASARELDPAACVARFDVQRDKIIRTEESREMGARYLSELDVGTRAECLRLCCETEACDVFVYEEKVWTGVMRGLLSKQRTQLATSARCPNERVGSCVQSGDVCARATGPGTPRYRASLVVPVLKFKRKKSYILNYIVYHPRDRRAKFCNT